MSERAYRRLPGRGRKSAGFLTLTAPTSTLWLGADHVLTVDSYGAAEDYRRFYFREIQAIAVRKTRTLLWVSALQAAVMASFVWAALAIGRESAVFFGILAALDAVFLLVHLARGTTCRTYVVTRVGREELAALRRTRQARRVLEVVRPLVVAAQREAALELRRARAEAGAAAPAVPEAAAAPPPAAPEPEAPSAEAPASEA